MTIALPDSPGPISVTWTPVDFGGRLTPPLGGPVQRINRLGNRWAMTVELPPMTPNAARAWIAALTRGLREGVSWRVRQVEVDTGTPGLPTVDGDDQAGAVLAVAAGTPRYAARVGQWLHLEHGGARYVHMVVAQAILDEDGAGEIVIEPPLRVEPADGDRVEIAAPVIEGDLDDGGVPWTIDRARRVGLSFTITEAA